MSTLIIILAETRTSELTFNNFKENLLNHLNADLCICIGATKNYDISNPFYQFAKYKFIYNEPNDYGIALDKAYNEIIKNNKIPLYSKINNYTINNNLIKFNEKNIYNYNNLVFDNNNIYEYNQLILPYNIIYKPNSFILQKHIYWKEFLKIKDQFLGGVLDKNNQHQGS